MRPDADRLGPCVDRAGDHRRALGNAGGFRGFGCHGTGDVTGPLQRRLFERGGAALPPGVVPAFALDVVQRRDLAGGLVIQHVGAGEAIREVGRGHEETPRARPGLRLLLPDPEDLRAARLRGERGSAHPGDLVDPELGGQLGDLIRRASVHAVEDRRAHRGAVLVDEQDARTHAAHADADDLDVGSRSGQLPGEGDELVPPHRAVHLDPAGVRAAHVVAPHRLRQDRAVLVDEDALAAGRADVDTDGAPHAHPPRSLALTGRRSLYAKSISRAIAR